MTVATDIKATIQPTQFAESGGDVYWFGPSDYLDIDRVDMTHEVIQTTGASVARVGSWAAFIITMYTRESGTLAATDLSIYGASYSLTLKVWDPVSKTLNTEWAVADQSAADGQIIIYPNNATFSPVTAGLYDYYVRVGDSRSAQLDVIMCSGKLEVMGQYE